MHTHTSGIKAAAGLLTPERWDVCLREGNVAQLTIPGALDRTRTFDVDVQLLARLPDAARQAELGLSLEVDGSGQWARNIAGSTPGETETLEYHCRLVIEPGRDVRLRARASLKKADLVALSLQAVEEVHEVHAATQAPAA
ncbi:MAG: hypothetical protein ACKOB5_00055 [Betaproteobacteria bacterium]